MAGRVSPGRLGQTSSDGKEGDSGEGAHCLGRGVIGTVVASCGLCRRAAPTEGPYRGCRRRWRGAGCGQVGTFPHERGEENDSNCRWVA